MLVLFKDVPLTTRRVQSLYDFYVAGVIKQKKGQKGIRQCITLSE